MWILKRLLSLCTQWIKKKDNTCNYLVTRIIQAIRSAEELFVDRNKIVTMKSLDNWVSVYGCLACEAAEDKVKNCGLHGGISNSRIYCLFTQKPRNACIKERRNTINNVCVWTRYRR